MGRRVFPSANNYGVADSLPSRIATEELMARWMDKRGRGSNDGFIVDPTGFQVSTATFPNINVAAGDAFLNGFLLQSNAVISHTLSSSTNTYYIYLRYTLDGNNLVNGLEITNNTSGTDPSNSFKIATVVISGGAFGTVTDLREVNPRITNSGYTGTGGTGTRQIIIGFTPRSIQVFDNSGAAGGGSDLRRSNSVQPALAAGRRVRIITRGFEVNSHVSNSGDSANWSGIEYSYLAIP